MTKVPPSEHSFRNKAGRALWGVVWLFLFRPTPKKLYAWRRLLLRLFGADLGSGTQVFPTVRIWAPWNLQMDDHACLADGVDCYNVAMIRMGRHALVSQRAFLCTATHDIDALNLPLRTAPVEIQEAAWVCAEAFISPGVIVETAAVVGARSVVTKSVAAGTVVAGNPARYIRDRRIPDETGEES